MIKAVFYKKNGQVSGFGITGHSDFAESGKDIVCASVSSAAMLVMNTVTEKEFFDSRASIVCDDNLLKIMLNEKSECSEKLFLSFKKHLEIISQEFKGNISVSVMEV